MKRFMFLSVGVLCLAIAALIGFYLGSHNAEAQSNIAIAGFSSISKYGTGEYCTVMLPNGDVYMREFYDWGVFAEPPAKNIGNFWEGATATNKSTWSGVKEQFKK